MKSIFLIALSVALTFGAKAQEVNIDVANATVKFLFHAKNVEGTLNGFLATIKFDPEHPETASISGSVETKSIKTGIDGRDHHLASADFFDAEKYPTMTFSASKIKKVEDGFSIIGNLTIKEVVKEEKFNLTMNDGNMILTSTIYSADYGIMNGKEREESKVDITISIPLL
jgi:polyisoprenoid-binding protein YceI